MIEVLMEKVELLESRMVEGELSAPEEPKTRRIESAFEEGGGI